MYIYTHMLHIYITYIHRERQKEQAINAKKKKKAEVEDREWWGHYFRQHGQRSPFEEVTFEQRCERREGASLESICSKSFKGERIEITERGQYGWNWVKMTLEISKIDLWEHDGRWNLKHISLQQKGRMGVEHIR